MKALLFQGVEQLQYGETAEPELLEPGDAIVRVSFCGICGSDLHILQGRELGVLPGTVFGHEFSGEVVACGSEVRSFSPGDPVCCPFSTNCGSCFYCSSELTCRCADGQVFGWVDAGGGLQGSHAEYVRVPMADSTLMHLPEGVSLEEAVLLADNLSTGFFCADLAGVQPGKMYVVLGCGTVGLSAILAARQRGAERILAVDRIESRRRQAAASGAEAAAPPETAVGLTAEWTQGRGADAVMDAVGSSEAQSLAYKLVRSGGVIATVGVQTAPQFSFSPIDAYNKNIEFKVGRCPARLYMQRIAPMVAEKQIDASALITHRLPLSQGIEAYRLFAERSEGYGKILLAPTR